MFFNCPSCKMSLSVAPEHAGRTVRCPGCNVKFTVPDFFSPAAPPQPGAPPEQKKETRGGWVEADPANPNIWFTLGLGLAIMAAILLLGLVLRGTYIYTILYERGWVNFAESFVFSWGMGILVLKFQKLRHQRNALLLDVLPRRLGREITQDTVAPFIGNLYKLPVRLRDSLMVNRIRKALELFETRPNNSEVAHMMSTQSEIDSIRVAGSYSLLKVFIWSIPILGFVGTVLGLSAAIGNFQGVMGNAKDIDALMNSLGGVTAGLGTSFDTTLLGLIYSIVLSFPMSAMQKLEEDNLNNIDAYCNETLLPRLNDGGSPNGGGSGAGVEIRDVLERLVDRLAKAQTQFLADLQATSVLVREQVQHLEQRAQEQSSLVQKTFVDSMQHVRHHTAQALEANIAVVTSHVGALERALTSLNNVLQAVGERQVHVEVKPRGWFGRWLGKG